MQALAVCEDCLHGGFFGLGYPELIFFLDSDLARNIFAAK